MSLLCLFFEPTQKHLLSFLLFFGLWTIQRSRFLVYGSLFFGVGRGFRWSLAESSRSGSLCLLLLELLIWSQSEEFWPDCKCVVLIESHALLRLLCSYKGWSVVERSIKGWFRRLSLLSETLIIGSREDLQELICVEASRCHELVFWRKWTGLFVWELGWRYVEHVWSWILREGVKRAWYLLVSHGFDMTYEWFKNWVSLLFKALFLLLMSYSHF